MREFALKDSPDGGVELNAAPAARPRFLALSRVACGPAGQGANPGQGGLRRAEPPVCWRIGEAQSINPLVSKPGAGSHLFTARAGSGRCRVSRVLLALDRVAAQH